MPPLIRLATPDDRDTIAILMRRAIDLLQRGFLDTAQIAASRAVMGLDMQLIADGTYFIAEIDERPAGCGGWSRRATLYGNDLSAGRDPRLLDPASDPARIRAMYTDPDCARRGVGRLVLERCEGAARAAGFTRTELMATLSGEPLYLAAGYRPIERIDASAERGVAVPLIRMAKTLA